MDTIKTYPTVVRTCIDVTESGEICCNDYIWLSETVEKVHGDVSKLKKENPDIVKYNPAATLSMRR